MFLFRLFFSLIGMCIALVLMPFRLIPFSLAVVLMPLKILLRLIVRNFVLIIIAVVVILLAISIHNAKTTLPELTPAPAPVQTTTTSVQTAQGVPVVERVLKKEDGDSAFATDLYALMTEPERAQYSQNFYWAMNNLADGQVHSWTSGNIAGSLRANDSFTSSGGTRCRHFSEALKVHTIQQNLTGMACDQGNAAWCKLKPNATAACGLSTSTGLFDGITSSLKDLF